MGTSVEFDYMCKDRICSHVRYNRIAGLVECVNYTSDPLEMVFGLNAPSMDRLEEFFRERVFPESRFNALDLCRDVGLDCFDAETLVHHNYGRLFTDDMWVRFEGVDMDWAHVSAMFPCIT